MKCSSDQNSFRGGVEVFSRRYTNEVDSDNNNEASVSPNALKYSYRVYERNSVKS